jgi:DNA polymerase I
METKNKVLYIDGFNIFYSCFATYQANDSNGEPVGGFIGFINQLRKLVDKFSPQKIVIVFDGPGSAERRRVVFSDYKGKRNRKKRFAIVDLGEGEKVEVDNEQMQLQALFTFLKLLPVDVIILPKYEADEVIAYLCNKNKDYTNIICTNDKDFYQLVDSNTFVYANQKKTLFTQEVIFEQHRVIPANFVYMRCIVGDVSDKLPGIKGLGKQTLLEKIPNLSTTPYTSFEDFWLEIENLEDDSKLGKKLKENKEQARLMYGLMKLDYTCLNQKAIEILDSQLEEQSKKPYSKMSLKMYCVKQRIEEHIKNFDFWIRPFNFTHHHIKLSV